MAPEAFQLDPDLEQLLTELAAETDSSLLRVPRPKAMPALFESDTFVSERMAGLLPVERELLRTHRHELAELLLEVCRYKLIEGPKSRHFISRYRGPNEVLTPLQPSEVRSRVLARPMELDDALDCPPAISLLNRCVAEPLADAPSIPELAAASGRLTPSVAAKGLAAQHYALSGLPCASLFLLSRQFAQAGTARGMSRIWSSIGFAYSQQTKPRQAHEAYKQACSHRDAAPGAWFSRFNFAFRLHDNNDIDACMKWLEGNSTATDSVSQWFAASLQARKSTGEWTPTHPMRVLTADIGSRYGEVARRLANVISA